MRTPRQASSTRPLAVLGAGDLVSHLTRADDDAGDYQFNVFRFGQRAETTHALRPTDLRDLVKLCQVVAFAIVDDGWIEDEQRGELLDLITELDQITSKWSGSAHD